MNVLSWQVAVRSFGTPLGPLHPFVNPTSGGWCWRLGSRRSVRNGWRNL